jgi:hypothetical protein
MIHKARDRCFVTAGQACVRIVTSEPWRIIEASTRRVETVRLVARLGAPAAQAISWLQGIRANRRRGQEAAGPVVFALSRS